MPLPTLIETRLFQRRADLRLGEDGRLALSIALAENPAAGVVEPGTGGLRKLRLGMQGRGKRGGARIIYFYAQLHGVVLLLTVYAKNEIATLSKAEKEYCEELSARSLESELSRYTPGCREELRRRFP